jgi:iron complex outermembrane receptor protein
MRLSLLAFTIFLLVGIVSYAEEAQQTPSAEKAAAPVSGQAGTPSVETVAAPITAPTGTPAATMPTAAPRVEPAVKKSVANVPNATHLEEATITATRTERTIEETPSSVTSVTKEDIKDTRMFGINEALSGIAGVQSETRNGAYDTRLIIRGAGLKAQYGVREIMVLLDGVPVTDPDGLSRLDVVNTQIVEQVDVLKGPNSTLYGANAAGGVVNIITKTPFKENSSVTAGYGNYNTQMYNVNYGNKIGDTYFLLSGSKRSTDSWREWNKFSTEQGNFKIGHLFDEKTSIEAAVNYSKADLQLPGGLTKAQYDQDITQSTSEPWKNSGRYSHSLLASVKFKKEINDFEIKPMVYYQKWDQFHPVTGMINDGGADIYGADIQVDMKHNIGSVKGLLTTGVSAQQDNTKGNKYTYRDTTKGAGGRITSTLSDAEGALAEIDDNRTQKTGIYVQESLRPTDRWVVDLGARYDKVDFHINEQTYMAYNYSSGTYTTSSSVVNNDRPFTAMSPRLGVVYKASSIAHVYGNVSTGFQTPQTSELVVNPELVPAKTINYETGIKSRFEGGHSIDLALFSTQVKDDIIQTVNPGNISSYSNAGKTKKEGAELSAKAQVVDNVFLGGSYTYSDFKFVNYIEPVRQGAVYVYNDRSGNQLPYIPKNQYSVFGLYKHPEGFKIRLETTTWGNYYMDNANSEKYEGYSFISNGMVGYEKKNFDVSFDVYNMLNKKYAMEVTKDTSNKVTYKPGAPRTYMVRLSYNF